MLTEIKDRELTLSCRAGYEDTNTAPLQIAVDTRLMPADFTRFSASSAKASAVLALSSAEERNLCANLALLGYGDISCIAFDNAARDRVGLCIAARGRDVIIVLRGTVGEEWYSNFDIGYAREHRGFATAADYAELRLSDYLVTHPIGSEPRFLVTGYSRGAAVANILAKRLCDRYGIDRVCAYTLAAPHTTISRRGARYSSVFNLIRDEDFFTRVPLSGWGYTRYGRDICLSDVGDAAGRYRQIAGRDYLGFVNAKPVDEILGVIITLAPNVHAYYERRREVGGRMLSLHEFMLAVASLLSDSDADTAADILLSALISDYSDMLTFLSSGADITDILSGPAGIPRCSIADSHSPAAYLAAMQECLE